MEFIVPVDYFKWGLHLMSTGPQIHSDIQTTWQTYSFKNNLIWVIRNYMEG